MVLAPTDFRAIEVGLPTLKWAFYRYESRLAAAPQMP